MKFIDLSVPLENNSHYAPWWGRNKVKYQDHKFGRRVIRLLFGVGRHFLRTGLGWANETIQLSTHGTTHVDAPWHYSPTCQGRPARTIDEMPLDWFYGNGIVLDFSNKKHGQEISREDMQAELKKIEHTLQAGDIVLIRTGSDRLLGKREYFTQGPGVSADATRWLIDQGVRLTGIDAWGWDMPLNVQAESAKRQKRNDIFWAAHFVGVDAEYCHMERLANLDKLPAKGFRVCAFPLKVKAGSAGPARVVAIIDEDIT